MNQRNGTTALQSGNLNRNGLRQIHFPDPLLLASNSGSGEAQATVAFLAPTPDARLKVKVTVAFVATAGNANPNISNAENIWIAAVDYEQGGIGGGGGRVLPVTDLEGLAASPTTFPQSADLIGYSRAFVTIADAIQVTLTLGSIGGGSAFAGNWIAQFRYQPNFCEFSSFEEWDAVRRLCLPQLTTARGVL